MEYIFIYVLFAGISFQAHNGTFYFITPIARCGLNRINRTIEEGGSWSHAGGRVKEIMDGGHRAGSRRSYHYKPPATDADRWLMKEYTVYPLHEVLGSNLEYIVFIC